MPVDRDNDEERESRVASILEKLREHRGSASDGKNPVPDSDRPAATPPEPSQGEIPNRADE
jgi:hypothetical protein